MAGMSAVNPILLYDPDGYEVARQDLKGRHSAGEAFLTAFLEHSQGPDIYGLCANDKIATRFRTTIESFGRGLTPRPLDRTQTDVLRRQGVLHLPIPGIAQEARTRSFLGDDAYAVCGITHSICSRGVLDGIADIAVAPVKPWDALICTSQAVHDALSGVLDRVEDGLRERLGATSFTRPLMPIVPLGVHAKRFARKGGDRERWRSQLGIADDAIAILFFGRLSVHAKAAPFQLAQAAQAAAVLSKKTIAIIWCGWFSNDFQQRVFMQTAKSMAPSVYFHHVDGRDADARFSIWSAADIFCSFSDNIQESFGLTVLEAMAAELPVVASNWSGYRMSLEHGKTGILIDSYLPQESLSEAAYRYVAGLDSYDLFVGGISELCFVDTGQAAQWLAALAGEKSLRRQLASAARRKVEASFDWSVVLPLYADLWREQLERLVQIRATCGRSPPPHSIYDPTKTFAGFSTKHLTPDDRLEPGPEFSRWKDLTTWPGIVINPNVLVGRAQYVALRQKFAEDGPRAVAQVLEDFPEKQRPSVLRSLYWLIKIGLLKMPAASAAKME